MSYIEHNGRRWCAEDIEGLERDVTALKNRLLDSEQSGAKLGDLCADLKRAMAALKEGLDYHAKDAAALEVVTGVMGFAARKQVRPSVLMQQQHVRMLRRLEAAGG